MNKFAQSDLKICLSPTLFLWLALDAADAAAVDEFEDLAISTHELIQVGLRGVLYFQPGFGLVRIWRPTKLI